MKADKQTPHYAFCLPWPFESLGGVNGVLQNLIREFQTAGDIAPLALEISDRTENVEAPWPSIRFGPVSSWNPQAPWRSLAALCLKAPVRLWKLHTLCRHYSIKVLNPHFIGMEYFPFALLRRCGLFRGRLILSFHGSDIHEMMQSSGLQRVLFSFLLSSADILVACSDGLREEVVSFVPHCAAKTFTIHNGIDAPGFVAGARGPFQLPERFAGRRFILNIGVFEYHKGHDILLRAFVKLRAAQPGVFLVIAGQKSSGATRKLSIDLGIDEDVLFYESIPHAEVAALLLRADIFVLSSRREGFAMALLEAGAAEKPVVTTRCCGTTELIDDGITGRIVPVEDSDSLAAAIGDLLSDPVGAQEMAVRLHRLVVERFTWKAAYGKYRQLGLE